MNVCGSFKDKRDSFGWISIGLHWATAAIVIAMWLIGQSISEVSSIDGVEARRDLHITIGLTGWLLLSARIIWRFVNSHPHVAGQSTRTHRIARSVHFLMLGLLSIVIIAGPLMVWIGSSETPLFSIVHRIHSVSANSLFACIVLHIVASLKHLMFHEDETIVRMLLPKK